MEIAFISSNRMLVEMDKENEAFYKENLEKWNSTKMFANILS